MLPRSITAPLVSLVLILFGLNACVTVGGVMVQDEDSHVAVVFSDHDRRLIHDYYRPQGKPLPPGLAKRRQLPPGLAKRKSLPPGLGGQRLPRTLEDQLSRLPSGYVRLRIDTHVVLMSERTRLVVDIIEDLGR